MRRASLRRRGARRVRTPGSAKLFDAIQLARHASEDALPMDLLVAGAVLEFGSDLRAAGEDATAWVRERGVASSA